MDGVGEMWDARESEELVRFLLQQHAKVEQVQQSFNRENSQT